MRRRTGPPERETKATITFRGLCLDCGNVWEEIEPPAVCLGCRSLRVRTIKTLTADEIRRLEQDVAEPLEQIVARAEHAASQPAGVVELTVTIHHHGVELARIPRVRFVREGWELAAEATELNVPVDRDMARNSIQIAIREPISDVIIVNIAARHEPVRRDYKLTFRDLRFGVAPICDRPT